MFKKNNLQCSICKREINGKEKIVAFLDLPSQLNMPYGLLTAGLAKCSNKIYCENCYHQK